MEVTNVTQLISNFAKLVGKDLISPSIDNTVFRMHYRIAVVLLLICSAITSVPFLTGEQIQCTSDTWDLDPYLIRSYCMYKAVPFGADESVLGNYYQDTDDYYGRTHPGVAKTVNFVPEPPYKHMYYWFPVLFCFQALSFYFPYLIWRDLEGRVIYTMLQPFLGTEMNKVDLANYDKLPVLASYFGDSVRNRGQYGSSLVLCELLNLVNLVCNIYCLDNLLGGAFKYYGHLYVLNMWADGQVFEKILPKLTKCGFSLYGKTGSIINHKILCTMPVNATTQQLLMVIWLYFAVLLLVSFLQILMRMLEITCRTLRCKMIKWKCDDEVDDNNLELLIKYCDFSDFILLCNIRDSLPRRSFADFIHLLSVKLFRLRNVAVQ